MVRTTARAVVYQLNEARRVRLWRRMINEEKRWERESKQLILILNAPWKKKDPRTGLEKKMRHLWFLEHPLQTTRGAFLTFTAINSCLDIFSLETNEIAQKNKSSIWSVQKNIPRDKNPAKIYNCTLENIVFGQHIQHQYRWGVQNSRRKVEEGGSQEIWLMRSKSWPSRRRNLQVLAKERSSLSTIPETRETTTAGKGRLKINEKSPKLSQVPLLNMPRSFLPWYLASVYWKHWAAQEESLLHQ